MYNPNEVLIGWTTIDHSTSMLDSENVRFEKGLIANAIEEIKSGGCKGITKCAIIHPQDAVDMGSPVDKNVSMEDFLAEPCVYGVSIYKTWNNRVVFE